MRIVRRRGVETANEARRATGGGGQLQACDLCRNATQTVFGEGSPSARLMLVGEQPGDKEDLAGHPFVGPAGQLLDRALEQAGIIRDERLCHQRRQALQVDAEGQAPHPPETECR